MRVSAFGIYVISGISLGYFLSIMSRTLLASSPVLAVNTFPATKITCLPLYAGLPMILIIVSLGDRFFMISF